MFTTSQITRVCEEIQRRVDSGFTSSQTKMPFVVAIDGRAASGKTTLAKRIAGCLDASLIHMDDFFLPPELRTAERLATTGGNIHHERFATEILPCIKETASFSYNVFDCVAEKIVGYCPIYNKIRVVEGAYSCHPIFGQYADLRIFCDISPEEQMARIVARTGQEKAQVFKEKWIPLEEKYLEQYQIKCNADLVL